jgi:LmbE family N-acetylglucosaminyl deacetylase
MRAARTRFAADAGSAPIPIRTLLGIWAHPDDEAYLSAGLMARVRDAGGRVAVVTATRGEVGTADPERWPRERLAPLRERELLESLAAVGVREHYWLGYRDGELPDVPVDDAVSRIVRLLRTIRPDTIVTFGAEGMTGHDDHRMVSRWVTEAWRRTGSTARLWYPTVTPEFHDEWGAFNDSIGLWFEGATPPLTPRNELAAEVRCTGSLLDRKYLALRAHASQTRPLEDLMGTEQFRRWWATESFVASDRRMQPSDGGGLGRVSGRHGTAAAR